MSMRKKNRTGGSNSCRLCDGRPLGRGDLLRVPLVREGALEVYHFIDVPKRDLGPSSPHESADPAAIQEVDRCRD